MTADPDLVARARGGDRDAAEEIARAIASDARSKRDSSSHRLNVVVGTLAVIAVIALMWRASGLTGAFGNGLLLGALLGFAVGVIAGRRYRHSSDSDA